MADRSLQRRTELKGKKVNYLFLVLFLFSAAVAFAAEPSENKTGDLQAPPPSSSSKAPLENSSSPLSSPSPMATEEASSLSPLNESDNAVTERMPPSLQVGGRFDINYSAGSAAAQGFALPSFELSLFGEIKPTLSYRLAVSQTREYSTALLPQILPTEGYVDVTTGRRNSPLSWLRLRVGMFTPEWSPWWTPSLGGINLPDYHLIDQAVLLSRDLGSEILFVPIKWVEMAIGYFNGTGIFASNTNNGHALTGKVEFKIPPDRFHDKFLFSVGANGYGFGQSTRGAINYKASYLLGFFARIERERNELSGEMMVGQFDDSTRSILPTGGAVYSRVFLIDWLSLLLRYETLSESPIQSGSIQRIQGGLVFALAAEANLFATFADVESGGAKEKITEIRLRLAM